MKKLIAKIMAACIGLGMTFGALGQAYPGVVQNG